MSILMLLQLLLLFATCRADLLSEDTVTFEASSTNEAGYYRLPKIAVPNTYDIFLEPDLEKFLFTGQVTIGLKTLDTTDLKDYLVLNAKNLTIDSTKISLESTGTAPGSKEVIKATDAKPEKEEFVRITFEKSLEKAKEYTLKISYSGQLNDQKKGFYRSKYLTADGSKKYIATTHFEPTGARLAFPCWDEPAYKATFKISIKHLSKYTAISNMPQDGNTTPVENGKITTTFKVTPKMSTYLVAFVVSDYNKKEDENFSVWTKPDALDRATYALNLGKKVIEKLDEYTRIDYTDYIPKMDQISIKDFTPGAMENWGLVTYKETALLYEPNVTTTAAKQSISTIITHEFAHQWFGNLVSPEWWKYIWLNEGFANYFQYYIMDQLEPKWRLMELYAVEPLQGQAFVFDAGENTRPMNKDVDSPSEISALFDKIAYEKAGSVIRMMSSILTPKNFQKGLQKYLNDKSLKVANSDELLTYLQNAANLDVNGKSLNSIMDEWINKPGYPVVNVTNNNGVLEISQKRFTLHETDDKTKWWVPITYTQQSKPDMVNTTWLQPDIEQLNITNVKKDEWVIVNVNQTGYYRVNYDTKNWKRLTDYLQTNNFKNVSPVTRAQLIDDALNLARARHLEYNIALSLTTYLAKDTDYIPWTAAFRNLNFLHGVLYKSESYPIFRLYVQYLMKELVKKIKYEPSTNDDHVTKLLKTNAMKWGCRVLDEKCTKYAQQQFNSWLANPNKYQLDADLKNNILCVGLRTSDENNWNKAKEALLNSTKDEDEIKNLLPILGCSGSLPVLKKLLLSSLEKNSTFTFSDVVQAVVADHIEGVNLVLSILREKEDKIRKLDNAEEQIKSCIETLGNQVTHKDQFLNLTIFSTNMEAKAEIVKNMVTTVTRKIQWIDSNSERIQTWLRTHEKHFYNSATTTTLASFLVALSIFVTRFC